MSNASFTGAAMVKSASSFEPAGRKDLLEVLVRRPDPA
jgi:hypothetical protein